MKVLSEVEVRVLGSLVEKELTTPEYYPLSLNALLNACNQKSNRDPVLKLEESAVSQALRSLEKEGLAGPADSMDSRVTKFGHRLQDVFNFDRREIAVLCELLLRGPQTPGELRSRTERMYPFEDLGQVQSTLQRLAHREPPITKVLPRPPGTKEARYAQLLSGEVQAAAPAAETQASSGPVLGEDDSERIARLESAVEALQNEIQDVKRQFAEFRKQFE